MKYIILLLIGLTTVSTFSLDKKLSQVNDNNLNSEVSSIEPISEPIKAEAVKEPTKDKKAGEDAKNEPRDVVKENPKNCDQATEWIYPDGSCHKKKTESIASSTTSNAPVSSGGCELVNKYSSWDKNVARAVCLAESGGNSNAANYNDNHGSCVGSFGLMQLACFWIPNPTDPEANMRKANEIYNSSGWSPWGAYTSGKYLKYL